MIFLSRDTTIVNFVFFLIACLITISLFVFINQAQPYVITYLLKSTENDGDLNGTLVFSDQLVSIILMVIEILYKFIFL